MICSEAGAFRPLLAAVVFVGAAAGCSRPPLLVPVTGVVLLDGKPLSSGVVQFQPAAGQAATGEISGDGTFKLSRFVPNDGVPPGTYRVAVTAFDPTAEVQAVENLIVPVKYTRFGSSGIEFTVFPGTTEPLVIALSSAEAAGAIESGTTEETAAERTTVEPTSTSGSPASHSSSHFFEGGRHGMPDETLGGA